MKNVRSYLFIAFLPLLFLQAACYEPVRCYECLHWECLRPVLGLEGGVAITSRAGKSQTFPIDSPLTDEFYEYSPNSKNQTRGIYGAFIGAQWQGFSCFDLQFTLNYNQSAPFDVQGILTQGVDIQSQDTYRYRYKIKVRQLLFETKLSYINCTLFRPYAILGLGSSFNRSYSFSTTVPDALTFTREYKNHTTSGFSYLIGLGVDIQVASCLWAGVSYRFTNLGRASLGAASIDDVSVSGSLSQNNFYASEFLALLTFVF